MKLFSGMMAAAIFATAMATGCTEAPRRYTEITPSIDVGPGRTIQSGESARVTATTRNLVGAQAIRWTVSPNVARIQPEEQANGQSALFTADQPGTYVITATADVGNGRMISDNTTVTVHGRPVTSDRINEPVPAPGMPR